MLRAASEKQLTSGHRLAGLRIVDRYILRQLLFSYVGVVGVIVFLLWVESVPRLLIEVSQIDQKLTIVARSLASLTPEYVAVGIPFAVYFCTAITFRRIALDSELEALAASGLSNWRILRQPLILALVSCVAVIGLRGFIQPASERELDAIGRSVKSGEFGYGLEAGVPHQLSRSTVLFFGHPGKSPNELDDVAFQSRDLTAIARSASISFSGRHHWRITLHDGNIFWRSKGSPQAFQFQTLGLSEPVAAPPDRPTPVSDRLDRLNLWQLVRSNLGSDSSDHALATASARFTGALFCLFLPLLAFAQAVPPKRSRSAIAFGLGIIEILLFWRMSALIEDRFTHNAFLAHGLLLAAFVALAVVVFRFQAVHGLGSVEQRLIDLLAALRRSLPGAAFVHKSGGDGQGVKTR